MDVIQQLNCILEDRLFWEDVECRSTRVEMVNGAQVEVNQTSGGYRWAMTVAGRKTESPHAFPTVLAAKGSLRDVVKEMLSTLAYQAMPRANVEM